MLKILIDGEVITSMDLFHDSFAKQAGFPEYYGRNLNAFWDCISTDVEGPIEIVWKNHKSSAQILGKKFETIKSLLMDAQKDRGDIELVWD